MNGLYDLFIACFYPFHLDVIQIFVKVDKLESRLTFKVVVPINNNPLLSDMIGICTVDYSDDYDCEGALKYYGNCLCICVNFVFENYC